MESVGKLAGGIAHDFNNLLTAIIGFASLAEAEQAPGTPMREWIEEIRRSGQQAAALTGQLLAFGRRQVLRPTDLDLNARRRRHSEDVAPVDRRAHRSRRAAVRGPHAGPRRSIAGGTGDREPGRERARRHAARGAADDSYPQRRDCAADGPGRARTWGRGLRRAGGGRHWRGDRAGSARARLRAVLHDEAARPRHRARPRDGVRRGQAERWRRAGAQRSRAGGPLHGAVARRVVRAGRPVLNRPRATPTEARRAGLQPRLDRTVAAGLQTRLSIRRRAPQPRRPAWRFRASPPSACRPSPRTRSR